MAVEIIYIALNELVEANDCKIQVMVCRKWDVLNVFGKFLSTDFIFSDNTGNVVHATAKSKFAHRFINKLSEGMIYSLGGFTIVPNKPEFRIVTTNPHMLELDGSTTMQKMDTTVTGFVRFPFQLVEFDDIEPADSKPLIDVIGCVTNVGKATKPTGSSTTLDLHLMNERGQLLRVTLWGDLGEDLLLKKFEHETRLIIILAAMNIKKFKDEVSLSSSSSTLIYTTDEIPEIANFKARLTDEALVQDAEATVLHGPRRGTLADLLRLGRGKTEEATFECLVRIRDIRTQSNWYYFSCSSGKCKKGVSRRSGKFWCESCETLISFPKTRFKLQLQIEDATATTIVTMFDDIAGKLVNANAETLLKEIEAGNDEAILPNAISNLRGSNHTLEIKSHTYYEHGTFESFTCTNVLAPPPSSPKDLKRKRLRKGAGIQLADADEAESSKIKCAEPSSPLTKNLLSDKHTLEREVNGGLVTPDPQQA